MRHAPIISLALLCSCIDESLLDDEPAMGDDWSELTLAKASVLNRAQPGDVIVSRGATCPWDPSWAGWSYWCHAAIVLSAAPNFRTVEIGSTSDQVSEKSSWSYYSGDAVRVALLRPTGLTAAVRAATAEYARYWLGGASYSLFARKTDAQSTTSYCSLVPWRAYKQAVGIDLDPNGGYWITPDDLFNSQRVTIIGVAQ